MIRIERILTGIDLGQDTERVISYAYFFGRLWNASIDLLYVIDYLVTPPAYMLPYLDEEKKVALKTMKEWQQKLIDLGVETKSEIVVGRLFESFELSLKNLRTDLLVLGHRHHPLRRSSSERLIKGLTIPMLVVRGEKSENVRIGEVNIKRLLCPIDFSEYSKKALSLAGQLSGLLRARLHVLHVLPVQKLKEKGQEKAIDEMTERTKNDLEDLTKKSGITIDQGLIRTGEPHLEIASYARDADIDLIIMGARGLGLIKGLFLGSVTEAVIRSSPSPVLIIH